MLVSGQVTAQPTLPAISAAADSGLVLLSWTCQYDGIRSIAVRRSNDSLANYKIVGYVRKLAKGQQAFVDGHPDTGYNYYKLNIVFNSGLSWSSNHCRIYVPVTNAAVPANDSLQHFTLTDVPAGSQKERSVTLSFDSTAKMGAAPPLPRKKLQLHFTEPDIEEAAYIPPRYLSVNRANGHVIISLPADHKGHHYSVKFYNANGKEIMEIPTIKAPSVIVDKRNFQHSGRYTFLLKQDGAVLEEGYVDVHL